jgi:hypothetical protein
MGLADRKIFMERPSVPARVSSKSGKLPRRDPIRKGDCGIGTPSLRKFPQEEYPTPKEARGERV